MPKAIITNSILSSIASAIRSKTGRASTMTPQQMIGEIESFEKGVELISQEQRNSLSIASGSYSNIGRYAFTECSSLTLASFPQCITIGGSAFSLCRSLTSVSFPTCTTINAYAFTNCSRLTLISFPVCTAVGMLAFASCSSLTSVSFPACTTISAYAFQNCISLTEANFPVCTSIGNYAFGNCFSLTSVSFPACTSISAYAFQSCSSLTSVSFPQCTIIGYSAFQYCSSLTEANFLACTTLTGSSIFHNCKSLSKLTLGTSNCTLSNVNVFYSTPMSNSTYLGYFGSIYVPSEYLSQYQTATNWSLYSSRFVGY